MKPTFTTIIALLLTIFSLRAQSEQPEEIIPADKRLPEYIHLLEGRRVGVLTNHTAVVDGVHLVDTLLHSGIDVKLIFAPEHGFRGTADAGEHIASSRDAYTGIEIVSLYGSSRQPKANDVFKCDVVVVDIQDVGVRFYTYLSTLYLMMQTCADVGVPMLLLDRPNPNGMYVDGPIIEEQYRSFVGMLPIPVVHGMTLGELARMINGEGWLRDGVKASLTVVPCLNYRRSMHYELPIAPSPNLPNALSVALYPSLCYFEGTSVSVGRGTEWPFQILGHPAMAGDFGFTPQSRPGAKTPPHQDKSCKGEDLRQKSIEEVVKQGIDLSYLVDAYRTLSAKGEQFFLGSFFEKLIGVGYVRDMIEMNYTAEEIEAMWADDVRNFCQQREKYLIYED
ncbi:MAG: DUF1343 domain-containing protein [Tidjanibacter sp.]|nr:DUF1343 domain-containing protein [Tidjanibacter sp.]